MKFKPMQVGLYTGLFFAVAHAIWSLMVLAKLAKPWLDFILGLHFVSNPFVVMPFSIGNALMLVAVVFVVGYIAGYFGTIAWNMMQKGR
jgi:hypothetical protein